MIQRYIAILLLLSTAALPMSALDLTVDQAVSIALEQNLDLQSVYIGQRTLEREKNSTWNNFLPEASVGVGLNRLNSLENKSAVIYPDNWSLALTFQSSLSLSSSTIFQIKDTLMNYQKGLISQTMAERQLTRDIRKAFYSLILQQRTIELTEDTIDTAYKRYERAQANYELGNIARVDVLSSRVAWENMKPELLNQQNSYETSLWEFKRVLGIDLEEELNLSGEIESTVRDFDPDSLISNYLYESLDVQYSAQVVEQLKVRKGLALSQTMTPVLGLGFTWLPFKNDIFNNTSSDPDWLDYNGAMNITLTLPLDGFIPNSSKNLIVKGLSDQMKQAELNLENQIRGTIIDLQSVVLRLNKSASTIETLKLNVELAQENYNLIDSSYNEGIMEFLDVQNANDELNKAMLQVLTEKYNYISALMDLIYITGNENIQ